MTLGEKISKLRKENHYTQEQLADVFGVSRQAISKWESDTTYPETDKLIRMGELFGCSLDYLLKDAEETVRKASPGEILPPREGRLRERKSERTVWGMPLWHVGRNARGFVAVGVNARGVIAVGLKARGIVSLGLLSVGLLSLGMLSVGLVSLGLFALGVLSAGCFCAGAVVAGAIGMGILSFGAIAIGDFSVGALAIGRYFALGDHARAMIALGSSKAVGSLLQKTGEMSGQDVMAVRQALDAVVPAHLAWAKAVIGLFL